MKDSLYHSLLRISALTVAVVLVFESGLISPVTKELSQNAHEYVASAISVGASVAPTEINTLTAKLAVKEKEISELEEALNNREREIAVNLNTSSTDGSSDMPVYVLSAILFILLVLILLNYVLDFMRRNKPVVDNHEQTA